MKDSSHSGKLDYPASGFTVFWDEHGLKIQVTDYHVEILHLSWEMILDLVNRARPREFPTDTSRKDEINSTST